MYLVPINLVCRACDSLRMVDWLDTTEPNPAMVARDECAGDILQPTMDKDLNSHLRATQLATVIAESHRVFGWGKPEANKDQARIAHLEKLLRCCYRVMARYLNTHETMILKRAIRKAGIDD